MPDFDRCYAITKGFEGGKVDNPNDPGGRTAFGVTNREYDKWLGYHRDVWLITEPEVRTIFYSNYWIPCGASGQPWPLNLVMFDCAVNSGVGRSTEFTSYTHDPAKHLAWRLYFVRWLAKPHKDTPEEQLRAAKARTFLKGWEKRITTLAAFAKVNDLEKVILP